MARIYLASSWRNEHQPSAVKVLRAAGHEVYDFREGGFGWRDVDPEWYHLPVEAQINSLEHPIAYSAFNRDLCALHWCDTCVLLLPAGRSASLELGYCAGQGKRTAVLFASDMELELMYRVADVITCSMDTLKEWLCSST